MSKYFVVTLGSLVYFNKPLNPRECWHSDLWRRPTATVCMALSFGSKDWLMSLIILGSVGIAYSDDEESGSRVGFSWFFWCFGFFRKQMLEVYLTCCVLVIFINSSYTMKSCPV